MAGLIMDKAGNLYGTTTLGGFITHVGYGTVFRLTPPSTAGGAWREAVLHSFRGQANADGANPYGGLAFSASGKLYGTTYGGGTANAGTIFELTPPAVVGGAWTESVIHHFGVQTTDGIQPRATPLIDQNGNLYGTTQAGGAYGFGTVWELTPPQSSGGAWTETILYSFAGSGAGDGASPYAALIMDPAGTLFGTTYSGGSATAAGGCSPQPYGGCGTVFALAPPSVLGGAWTETVLYSFTGVNGDGSGPAAGVTFGANGALYGTTEYGGTSQGYQDGSIYRLMPPSVPGGTWTETVIYGFTSYSNAYPSAALTPTSSGVLYGSSCCAVFELQP